MGKEIYLRNFDQYADVLQYDTRSGQHRILTRAEFNQKGLSLHFGFFVTEAGKTVGVYASPIGPILFFDEKQWVCTYGMARAKVLDNIEPGVHEFIFHHKQCYPGDNFELVERHFRYSNRAELDTNPYDTARDDIDMFFMLTQAMCRPQFYSNFTKGFDVANACKEDVKVPDIAIATMLPA